MNLNNQINGGNMKSWWIIIVALFLAGWAHAAEGLQPYLLLEETQGNSRVNLTELKEGLEEEGFVVLGSYEPAEDSRRKVLSFTHPKLLKVVSGLRETAGYFSVWRMALTEAETGTEISLQNPEYWGNAYLQDEYPVAESTVKELISRILVAFGSGSSNKAFGSSQELSAEDLREYHYMFSMPYFEDQVELGEFESHNQALETIETNLRNSENCIKVFRQTVKSQQTVLNGIGLKGTTGEGHFLPIIDIAEHKHTAFLPYELLVNGKKVYMLHGRFRIVVSFPDLTMMTFGKIMSTPGRH
ncbi:MAG: hypothetical protein CM15mP45_01640 [Deltaproteobacteria bacterium]|nr:MAG: hypothetical protein CM15mP45_01640 [Deltaproteobacteria bacterium]